MTITKNHSDILRILSEKLRYLNYSSKTVAMYSHYARRFLEAVDKPHQHLTGADFQSYLDRTKFSSISQQNQVISSIRFLYEKVLNRKYAKVDFQRPRGESRLPRIIDREYLVNRIAAIPNLKHRAILSIAFSVGLRVSEVINLRIADIDSSRMVITLRQAKGRKDRVAPLSPMVLATLRDYFRAYKPKEYLFNGQKSDKYSATSCNQLVKQYLGRQYHFHLLRHSCFTSLLESGTDIRIIQRIAGHRSTRTTEIYTHVSSRVLSRVPLPL